MGFASSPTGLNTAARVENNILDNASASLMFVDLATSRVGFGTAAPTAGFKVTVSGNLRVAGTCLITGKLTVNGAIDPTSLRLSDIAAGTDLYFESANGATAAVSAANEGRFRYNQPTQTWQMSMNGAAYVDIASGTGSGWTDDGTVVRLTTVTDQVGIGTAAPVANYKLQVNGAVNVVGGTLPVGVNALALTATLPATASLVGVFFSITPNAAGDNQAAQNVILNAGYTGTAPTYGIVAQNVTAAVNNKAYGIHTTTSGARAGGVNVGIFASGTSAAASFWGIYVTTDAAIVDAPTGTTLFGGNAGTSGATFFALLGGGTSSMLWSQNQLVFTPAVDGSILRLNTSAGTQTLAMDLTAGDKKLMLVNNTNLYMENGNATLSGASSGKLRYDTATQTFQISQNGSAYASLSAGTWTRSGTIISQLTNGDEVQLNNVTPTVIITLRPNTLVGTSQTQNHLNVTATLPAVTTTYIAAVLFNINGAGSSANPQAALRALLQAGYTGSNGTFGADFSNSSIGTGTDIFSTSSSNRGAYGSATATTTGTNIGIHGGASGGNISIGIVGQSTTNKAGAVNIGVAGFGLNAGGGGAVQIGGYFGLQGSNPTFTGADAALVADNGATGGVVFLARAAGVNIWSATASTIIPATFNTITIGTSLLQFLSVTVSLLTVFPSAGAANASFQLDGSALQWGAGGASALDTRLRRSAANTLRLDNTASGSADFLPGADALGNIGLAATRWQNGFFQFLTTGDLDLKSEDGHWTLQEKGDGIVAINRRTGKKYRVALEEMV